MSEVSLLRFDEAFAESFEETLSEVLGKRVTKAFFVYLENYAGIGRGEMCQGYEEASKAMSEIFGKGAKVLGRRIVRKLCDKLEVEQIELSDRSLVENIRILGEQKFKWIPTKQKSVLSI
jgi:hypothetical protein